MRKNLKNRLIAVGWVAFSGVAACTVVEVKDDAGAAGPSSTGSAGSGTAGSSAGSGGTSSTAGSAGQGGSAPSTDGGNVALADASLPGYKDSYAADAACINDSTDGGDMANPDLCGKLNGADGSSQCYDASAGAQLCDLMRQNARPGAFQVFYNCIDAQTKNNPCATVDQVSVCLDDTHWPTGCQVGKVVVSNGKQWDCTNLVAKCPADDAGNGFTLGQCDFIMNVFTDEARTKIFNCYLINNNDPATCSDDFNNCVFQL